MDIEKNHAKLFEVFDHQVVAYLAMPDDDEDDGICIVFRLWDNDAEIRTSVYFADYGQGIKAFDNVTSGEIGDLIHSYIE